MAPSRRERSWKPVLDALAELAGDAPVLDATGSEATAASGSTATESSGVCSAAPLRRRSGSPPDRRRLRRRPDGRTFMRGRLEAGRLGTPGLTFSTGSEHGRLLEDASPRPAPLRRAPHRVPYAGAPTACPTGSVPRRTTVPWQGKLPDRVQRPGTLHSTRALQRTPAWTGRRQVSWLVRPQRPAGLVGIRRTGDRSARANAAHGERQRPAKRNDRCRRGRGDVSRGCRRRMVELRGVEPLTS